MRIAFAILNAVDMKLECPNYKIRIFDWLLTIFTENLNKISHSNI